MVGEAVLDNLDLLQEMDLVGALADDHGVTEFGVYRLSRAFWGDPIYRMEDVDFETLDQIPQVTT